MNQFKKTEGYRKVKLLGKMFRESVFARYIPTRVIRKYLVRKIKQFRFKSKLKKSRCVPIFVYQMGKVGSKSITKSLESFYEGVVIHGHGNDIGEKDWRCQCLIDWAQQGGRLKIISPVREPIGRHISAFFQNIETKGLKGVDKTLFPVSKLAELFFNNSDPSVSEVDRRFMSYSVPFEWFDKNIKKHFNIDVYSSPFPVDGFSIFSNENVELLVLRIDLNDDMKEKVISDFTRSPDFNLEQANVGSSKGYSDKYKEFKKIIVLPESYLDLMCSSKYFKHFYSDSEITRVRNKWTR